VSIRQRADDIARSQAVKRRKRVGPRFERMPYSAEPRKRLRVEAFQAVFDKDVGKRFTLKYVQLVPRPLSQTDVFDASPVTLKPVHRERLPVDRAVDPPALAHDGAEPIDDCAEHIEYDRTYVLRIERRQCHDFLPNRLVNLSTSTSEATRSSS